MINKMKEKGITLIALVVTIVILLILAGVTLNLSLSQNGLFSRAKDSADRYKKAQADEVDLISEIGKEMYREYVGATITGYNPVKKTAENPCTIETITSGHTETQDFTTDSGMKWRIWDFDGSTLRIIGDPTTQNLTLSGAAGYNNGLWAIDKICKECYSNNKPGVTVTSLKRSDIQKVSSYDYTQYKHRQSGEDAWKEVTDDSNDEELIHFGESKTYDINNKYPKMWGDNDQNWTYKYDKNTKKASGIDKECTTWENVGTEEGKIKEKMTSGTESIIFKQSYYAHTYTEEEFTNKIYYNLIFKKSDNTYGDYLLASRDVMLYDETCGFGLLSIFSVHSRIAGESLCGSDDKEYSRERAVRPMVSIDIKQSGCTLIPKYRRKWKYCVM